MGFRPTRLLLTAVVLLVTVGVAACGGSSKPNSSTLGPRVLIAGAACSSSSSASSHTGVGKTKTVSKPTKCTVILTSGVRYQCLASASKHLSPANLPSNRHCRKLASLRAPKSWLPVLRKLADARICLRRHRQSVAGGAVVSAVANADTPAGEVIVAGRPVGMLVGFYWTAAGARKAASATAAHSHGAHVARRGNVTILWYFPKLLPKGRLATVKSCVFA
jgi:hypothetical protein